MKFPSGLLLGLFILVCAVIIAWLNDFTKAKKAKAANAGTSKGQPTSPRSPWLWLLLMIGFAVIMAVVAPRNPQRKAVPPANPKTAFLCPVLMVGAVLLIVVWFARAYFRHYDRRVVLAYRRADEGDVEGAITDLRRAIEEKGMSVNRANGLGVLLSQQKKWEEALAAFQEGDRCGGEKDALNRWHVGLALARTGRGEEARPYVLKAAELAPHWPLIGCQVCRLLVELGYHDDAREVLRKVNEAFERTTHLSSSSRKQAETQIEECRALVEGKPPKGA